MTRPAVIYIDVDDTLIRSFGSKRIPMTSSVEFVRELHAHGAVLYCWSRGGDTYAREVCRSLGIESLFAGFLWKPDALFDDAPVASWLRGELHPNAVAGASAGEAAESLLREVDEGRR